MRAAILKELKAKLEIEERAVPTPGHGEVLIRVHACGICHGDLMVRNGEFPFVRPPIVPGYEVAGVVEALGPGVELSATRYAGRPSVAFFLLWPL